MVCAGSYVQMRFPCTHTRPGSHRHGETRAAWHQTQRQLLVLCLSRIMVRVMRLVEVGAMVLVLLLSKAIVKAELGMEMGAECMLRPA